MPDFITVPLPADLPTDWAAGQTVAPDGADAGLSEQHGYNYLMEQVNNAQTAAAQCGTAIEEAKGQIGQCIPASEKGAANGVATLDENGVLSASQTPPLDYLPLAGGTMTGAINMNSKRITNLPAPSATSDPARLSDVNTRLPLAGGTMTGNINMNSKRITNLPAPASNAEPLRRIDGVSNATATALGIAAGSLPDAAFQKLIDKVNTAQSTADSVLDFKQIGTANLAGTKAGAITINLTQQLNGLKELLIIADGIQADGTSGTILFDETLTTLFEGKSTNNGVPFTPPQPNFLMNASNTNKTYGYIYAIFYDMGNSGILINASSPLQENAASTSIRFWTSTFKLVTGIGSKVITTSNINLYGGSIKVYGR